MKRKSTSQRVLEHLAFWTKDRERRRASELGRVAWPDLTKQPDRTAIHQMLERLKARGLVVEDHNDAWQLTDKGRTRTETPA